MCTSRELFHRTFFANQSIFKLGVAKDLIVVLACILLLLLDQRLAAFHQLFSGTSVGPSKSPIDKIIGLQGHLTF